MIQRLHVMKLKKKHKLLKYYFNKGVLTNFYILLCFLLTIEALLMPANIYSWESSIKAFQPKEKPLLLCHYIISKLKETEY